MKKISLKKYLKATSIVLAYHQQMENDISEFGKKFENSKSKEDLKVGDFVECIDVHSNIADNLTRHLRYEVVKVDQQHRDKFFTIITDQNKKRSYNVKNSQFKAI